MSLQAGRAVLWFEYVQLILQQRTPRLWPCFSGLTPLTTKPQALPQQAPHPCIATTTDDSLILLAVCDKHGLIRPGEQ